RMLGNITWPSTGNHSRALGIVANRTEVSGDRAVRQRARLQITGPVLAGTAILAIALGLAYPVFATPVRLRQDMPSSPSGLTLDGYAWMENGTLLNGTGDVISFGGDLEAIRWLNGNADQTAVIVEAGIGPY